ncbi:hypothetical protein CPT_Muldoon_251 [Serratia phage Muldoon]|uniref:Uncharacterized protein n=1 Tax=Serratia phage Muldoon TaxID=2601678 RepID=A0A5P8PHK8_9CAUD|nr:hypothetical protein HYP94_gp139 [Serratia phage Muldoon]QFR56202.1 hypothetical protein CPT_Muldoon_251 [Serratia phage Muldoon]
MELIRLQFPYNTLPMFNAIFAISVTNDNAAYMNYVDAVSVDAPELHFEVEVMANEIFLNDFDTMCKMMKLHYKNVTP